MKMTDKEREGYDVLCAEMPSSLAMELVEFRREKKAKITARIARALLKEYKAYGDIEKAIEIQMVRNWIGFEASWTGRIVQPSRQPMPTPFQQRHRNAIDAFDRAIGVPVHDQPSLYDYDLEPANWRPH